ncbi:52 kDa repressor of the inhibitor of the protein kinase-like Protein [Oopsacas minuta]|uniref:52 kDa repressor of the inhibitor of the protein kinase-like Protein n=1 Tax=Oopsacas minuta TaxID=111878 RepID=A0AAV7KJQ6_9METZ|nr:52 kDa repressor of the inhibitor of the protein kinase-like Protein [Oopsacas minuta]
MRGQGYDNAVTMAGVHSGVQRRILDANKLAIYIPSNNHSLNLGGVHSAQASVNAITYFSTLDRLFAFFSASTHRCEVFKQHVPGRTVKKTCEIGLSSRYDSGDAIISSFESIIDALEQLRDSSHGTAITRSEANIVLSSILTYTFLAYLNFWNPVLKEINDTQIFLQTCDLGLEFVLPSLEPL